MTFFSQARWACGTTHFICLCTICYLIYHHKFVTCDTTINLLPMIQPSICYLRYNHQFVVVDVYKPKEHRVNNHLYWCHGSHNSHVINHQKSVNCHGVLSEIIQKIKIIMCFTCFTIYYAYNLGGGV